MIGLLEPLRKLSPNLSIATSQNEIEITIPFSDVAEAIRNSMNEQLRQISSISIDYSGIKIKIRL